MKDEIHLHKAHLGGVPVGQLQRGGLIDQGGLFGVMGPLIARFTLIELQESVNCGGADGLELHGRVPGDLKVVSAYQRIHLGPKQGRKALSAGIIEQFPAIEQDPMDFCTITTRSLLRSRSGLKQQSIDLSNDIFSGLPRISTILIENSSFLFPRSSGIGL